MQAAFSAPALHSGKKGMVTVSSNRGVLEWLPSAAPDADGKNEGSVVIRLDDIKGLQATPPTNPKARIRILTSSQAQFIFELPNRPNLESLKAVLSSATSAANATSASTSTAATPSPSSAVSTPGLSASLESQKTLMLPKGISDAELVADTNLQLNLLKSNGELQQQFLDAVISQRLPADEFWKSRIPILRMHHLIQTQKRGPYNVLASIKPVSASQGDSGGNAQVKVSLSPEKIKDIFHQYPVVRKAYDENVPPLTEAVFWSRFFLSKLCRRLRGERIGSNDAHDTVMDKYLELDENGKTAEQQQIENENAKVLRFVDIEANQEDDSQRAGNRPDITMRDTTTKDTLTIIRTINKLSQRIVEGVESDAQHPTDEQENIKARELTLQDLKPEKEISHIKLHLHNKKDSVYTDTGNGNEMTRVKEETQNKKDVIDNPDEVLRQMRSSLHTNSLPQLLSSSIPSASIMYKAQSEIHTLVRAKMETEANEAENGQDSETPAGDANTIKDMRLSHMTSIEFLHHFWTAYLSGDPTKATALLPSLVSSIEKSGQRLEAAVERHAESIDDLTVAKKEKTRVRKYVQITIDALKNAFDTYNTTLKEQQAATAMFGGPGPGLATDPSTPAMSSEDGISTPL
ncbi:hypothetical protein V1511DRAFT_509941 [Dipodascopsis uninucleata]